MAEPDSERRVGPANGTGLLCTKAAASFLLLLAVASWGCVYLSIIPSFASLLAGAGARFSLAVRVGIAATGFLWGLPLLALLGLLLWAGFGLRNARAGAGLLLGAALVATALSQALILWSVHDVLPYLAAR